MADVVLTSAERDVITERRRQVEVEGFTADHDDQHDAGQLAAAAAAYVLEATFDGPNAKGRWYEMVWPWHARWWKPGSVRRMLVKAAALIIAEIERIDRLEAGNG